MTSPHQQAPVVGTGPSVRGGDGGGVGADSGVNGTTAANITSDIPATPSTAVRNLNLDIRTVNGVNTNGTRSPAAANASVAAPPSTSDTIHNADPAAGPGGGTASQPLRSSTGFPSPGRDKAHMNPKFIDDRTRITFGIQQSLPEAVRRSVRDNWEKCLLGSDFHQAFVLNASIHHATPAAIQRGMRDFGKAFIAAAKQEIIQQMTADDLDQVANSILSKASNSFLDKALENRLQTIEGTKLINALARAERLGYDAGDAGDEDEGRPDAAAAAPIPTPARNAAPSQPAATPGPAPSGQVAPSPLNSQTLHCRICFRRFSHQSAHDYHMKGKVCTRSPNSPAGFKFNCQHCGQGFTTAMGLQYHNAKKVCGDFGQSPARPSPALANPAAATTSTPIPKTPSTMKTVTPAPVSSPAIPTPLTGSSSQPGGLPADPYAHLTPAQLSAMQEELRQAEILYSNRMRQANIIPDENERKNKLDGLANSFGTKQSMIRKKYGVRLRMRRTKAEIQAERDRMKYKTAAELQADIGIANTGVGRPLIPSYSPYHASPGSNSTLSNPNSRPGSSGGRSKWAAVNQPAAPATVLASSLPVPQPKLEDTPDYSKYSSGTKRHLGSAQGDSPNSKRIAYTDMSGLSGTGAQAETLDPTLPLPKSAGTAAEPMALDSDSSDGDDADIPAELPASVRQSLARSSPVGV